MFLSPRVVTNCYFSFKFIITDTHCVFWKLVFSGLSCFINNFFVKFDLSIELCRFLFPNRLRHRIWYCPANIFVVVVDSYLAQTQNWALTPIRPTPSDRPRVPRAPPPVGFCQRSTGVSLASIDGHSNKCLGALRHVSLAHSAVGGWIINGVWFISAYTPHYLGEKLNATRTHYVWSNPTTKTLQTNEKGNH